MIALNLIVTVYIVTYLAGTATSLVVDYLNLKHIQTKGDKVPIVFQDVIDQDQLMAIHHYTIDKIHCKLVQTVFDKSCFLIIILSGMLPKLAESLARIHYLPAGLIFFAAIGLLLYCIDLPFDYYDSFNIEAKYGFNTKTRIIWLGDQVKSLLITSILGTILIAIVLGMIKHAGQSWWIWAWAAVLGFQLMMTMLYPTIIAPLFNTFTPLQDSDLKSAIERLALSQHISIDGIYQMDATQRTRHTNAYFTGLGRTKRIVLYDSLIQSHGADEILAILAHEIGHLKKNHIKKQLVFSGIISLFLFYLASKLLTWAALFQSFGFSTLTAYSGIFLVGVVWGPLGFFLTPLALAVSRKYEREADDFAGSILNTSGSLSKALKKMAKDNLANLQPHPIYVWFNYSHPPLLERVAYLEAFM